MGNVPTTSTTLLRDLAQDSQHARWGEVEDNAPYRDENIGRAACPQAAEAVVEE